MSKKGEWYLDETGKLIIGIALLLFLIGFAILARDKIASTITNFFNGGLL